ncbi:type II secretory pathway pseudopilin PulG [Paraburkholderia sp. MM5496-R1]|uniref:DUF4148 domain-containing protein n=1 Tax=Paraburkholderia tuberum TaxID=157910 RepID=A0A1H1KAR9_9BURK|nr:MULTISPECIES: DUF4148 domain-containing protein [Paraburkholderia]MBC8725199.1 DUF4148 domain-containing protein [Paraburkholderia sp. 31.1]SDR59428.1 protein of unknown function [Paraburkholderia tuberum]
MAKAFIPVLALVSVLALPTVASAHNNGPLTREQVRAELVQLQQAGYGRNHGDAHYPAHIQATLASVAAQQQAPSGYGGVKSGSAASGAPTQWASDHSAYKGG